MLSRRLHLTYLLDFYIDCLQHHRSVLLGHKILTPLRPDLGRVRVGSSGLEIGELTDFG